MQEFSKMTTPEKWQHILTQYLDHNLPVPADMVRWILLETAPKGAA
jgi:hypothetical protein